MSVFIKISVGGYEKENTEVALLAHASQFEIIEDGILDWFLFADYIICIKISEAGDVAIIPSCLHPVLIARLWGIIVGSGTSLSFVPMRQLQLSVYLGYTRPALEP